MKSSKSLELLFYSEARARRYLSEKSWQHKPHFCIRCQSKKIYRLGDRRYRCAQCGYTFQEFTGRWIGEIKISAAQWLWALKLFELELAPDRIAEEIGVSYPTVLKAARLIRSAIVQQYLSAKATTAEVYWHKVVLDSLQKKSNAAQQGNYAPIFKIQERNGRLDVVPVHNLSEETLRKKNGLTKLGQVFYAGENSHVLMLPGSRRFNYPVSTASARSTPGAGSAGNFLSFAKDRFTKMPRISAQQFPLYLMEIKFRYDHRSDDTFDLLAGAIAQLVPNRLKIRK